MYLQFSNGAWFLTGELRQSCCKLRVWCRLFDELFCNRRQAKKDSHRNVYSHRHCEKWRAFQRHCEPAGTSSASLLARWTGEIIRIQFVQLRNLTFHRHRNRSLAVHNISIFKLTVSLLTGTNSWLPTDFNHIQIYRKISPTDFPATRVRWKKGKELLLTILFKSSSRIFWL